MTTLKNFEWKENGEDEKGYFFTLTDTFHHCDYNVVLIKDDGKVTVNDAYIDTVPHDVAAAIAPRIDFFQTMIKLGCRKGKENCAANKEC